MRVLIDTNVILDAIEVRENFCEDSSRILTSAAKYNGYIAASSVTDIYYIEHRRNHDKAKTLDLMKKLFKLFDILDTTSADCRNALHSPLPDFEDAILVESALREGIDYIVTRNVKDFKGSPVKVRTPAEFLNILSPKQL